MRLRSLLAIFAMVMGALAISVPAFAATTHNGPPIGTNIGGGSQGKGGGPGKDDPCGGGTLDTFNSGSSKGCQPSDPTWNNCFPGGQQHEYTISDRSTLPGDNCFPQPKPPVNCHDQWGWQDSWVNVNGHETDRKTWGEGTCFVSYPEPRPCLCQVQDITFLFAPSPGRGTGTWLLETRGPALHDGEALIYDGSTWTVEGWAPYGHGSLGTGRYFVLDRGGSELTGSIPEGTRIARTICLNEFRPLI